MVWLLSNLCVCKTRKSVYELIDLWASTGCGQDEICNTLLNTFDLAVGDVYTSNQKYGTAADPPGYIVSS